MTDKVISVKMIPCVEIRVHSSCSTPGRDYFFNKQFRKPGPAAKYWALYRAFERTYELREKGLFPNGHGEYEYRNALEKKLYRRSKPIFERLLTVSK